jgi:molecular chaperone GrpE (heat shock protein)
MMCSEDEVYSREQELLQALKKEFEVLELHILSLQKKMEELRKRQERESEVLDTLIQKHDDLQEARTEEDYRFIRLLSS